MTDTEKLLEYLKGGSKGNLDLRGADLRGADLRGADFSGANLAGVNLTGADVRGADFSGANLDGVDISHTKFNNTKLSGEFQRERNSDNLNGELDNFLLENNQTKKLNEIQSGRLEYPYPQPIRPLLLQIEIGESVSYEATRTMSIRQSINSIQVETAKRFSTRKIDEKLVVTRLEDKNIPELLDNNNKEKANPIIQDLQQLKVGESVNFDAEQTNWIRSAINNLFLGSVKRFDTRMNGNDIIVTRKEDKKISELIDIVTTEKTYPKQIDPILQRLDIGESATFDAARTNSIQVTINILSIGSAKRFKTRKVGDELIVTRLEDNKISKLPDNTNKEKANPNPIIQVVQQLEVGESVNFDAVEAQSIRNAISNFSYGNIRKFKTRKVGDTLVVMRLTDKVIKDNTYPKNVLPVIKKLKIGESATYKISRTNTIRSTINNYKQGNLKDFETKKIGDKLVVTRLADIVEQKKNH